MSFMAVFTLIGGFSLTVIPGLVFPMLAWLLNIMPVGPFTMMETSVALFATLGAGGLLVLQVYQAARGETYWEFQRGVTTYKQSFSETMRELMGSNWWICWLCPLIPSHLLGNGADYKPREESHAHHHPAPNSTVPPQDMRRKLVGES